MNENRNIKEAPNISELGLGKLIDDKMSRFMIIFILMQYKDCTAVDIQRILGTYRNEVDRHLKIYKEEGLITEEKMKGKGNRKFLRINKVNGKKIVKEFYGCQAYTICSSLTYLFKNRLDKITVKDAIKEIKTKYKIPT